MWLTRSRNWILPRLKYFQTNKKLRFCSRKLETFKKYFNDFESRKPVFNSNKNVNDFLWTILAKVANKFRFRNFAKFKISYFAKMREISRNTKVKFGQNFAFRETRNQNLANLLAIFQKRDDFLRKKCKIILIFGTQCSSNLNRS